MFIESELIRIQKKIEKVRDTELETIVPIYLTNHCHSDCKICEMRKSNSNLERKRGSMEEIKEQLRILYEIEKIRAVLILTGEYLDGQERKENFKIVIATIKTAFEMGFEKVNFNIGALTNEEIDELYNTFPNKSQLCLSLFQETYNIDLYHNFFGNETHSIPKSHYEFRISTPERWINRGFNRINIGILSGLGNPNSDVDCLIEHANKLHTRGGEVEISLPRIRGTKDVPCKITDEEFIKIVLKVAECCPWAKIILTTREDIHLIKKVLPVIGVISPGTSDVLPYTTKGEIPNNRKTSQFFIKDKRARPSWILNDIKTNSNYSIKYFNDLD